MPFENLTFFLLGQGVEHRTQLPADVSENGFPPSLGHKHHMVCSPTSSGLGSDTVLTLILPQGFHQTTWGRILLPERSNLFESHWSNQWLTNFSYLREPGGHIITFDPPNAVNGTYALSINPGGAITGYFVDSVGVEHGFLRRNDGFFTTFDVPGALGTEPGTINPSGAVSGDYFDPSGVYHGFVRAADGTITTLDIPDAGTNPGEGTFPIGITPGATVPGSYCDDV